MSPTQAALAHFRREGFEPYVTEKFIKIPPKEGGGRKGKFKFGFRKDAYGFGDILVYHEAKKITALIQACTRSDMANRRAKILINPKASGWVRAGNKIYLSALAKRKTRGSKRIRYEVVVEEVTP